MREIVTKSLQEKSSRRLDAGKRDEAPARGNPEKSRRRERYVKTGEDISEIISGIVGNLERGKKYQSRYLEVLLAAAKLFSRKGFHAATTTDIADELGVQQASLYYYLKSKDQALEQICEGAIQGYVRFSSLIKKSRAPAREKLRDLIFMHLKTLKERPHFFKVFQNNRKDLREKVRHKIGIQIRIYEKNVESIIKQGILSGELRPGLNTLHAAMALISLCNSVSDWWEVRSAASIEDIAHDLSDIFIAGVVAATEG